MKKIYFLLVIFIPLFSFSQILTGNNLTMQDGQFILMSNCNNIDTIFDPGGQNASYPAANVGYTITICPPSPTPTDTPFLGFEWTDINLGANDNISFYDGPGTSSPLMATITASSGVGVGDQLISTVINDGGANKCVTIQFVSDAGPEVGDFAFELFCTAPCQSVNLDSIAVTPAPTDSGYLYVLEGTEVCFEAFGEYLQNNNYYPQDDASSTFIWTFGDGSVDTGQVVCHTYTGSSIYEVNLQIIDANDCSRQDGNVAYDSDGDGIKVVVLPLLDLGGFDTTICFGDTIDYNIIIPGQQVNGLIQGPVISPTSTVTVVDSTFIPDDSDNDTWNGISTPVIVDVPIGGYTNGTALTDVNDLWNFCINMEHSYVGDLDIIIECPNGQQAYIVDNEDFDNVGADNFGIPGTPDGAAGTPAQFDPEQNPPGTGYDYCFSPNATMGDLTQEAGYPAGSYDIEGNWNDLLGCPMNGIWQIIVIDDFGGDNGWVFSTTVEFNPAFLANADDTVQVYYEIDGAWQFDTDIISAPLTQNNVTIVPSSIGDHTYVYEAYDIFGNLYIEEFDVYVKDVGIDVLYSDTSICLGEQVELAVEVTGQDAFYSECTYTLDMLDNFGDGWNGAEVEVLADGVSIGFYSAVGNGSVETFIVNSGATVELIYTSGAFENENTYSLLDGDGVNIFSDGPNPATGLVFTTSANCSGGPLPIYTPSATNSFVSDTFCNYTLDMFDSFGDGWNGGFVEVFSDGTSIGTFSATGNGSAANFSAIYGEDLELVYTSASWEGENTYNLLDPNGNIVFSDGPTPATGSVFTVIDGCIIDQPAGVYFSWDPNNVDPNTGNPYTAFASPSTTTVYTVTGEFSDGCSYSDQVTVNVSDISYTISPNVTICDGDTAPLSIVGGTFYDWTPDDGSLDNTSIANPVATPSVTTNYVVDISDNICTIQDSVLVTVNPLPSAEINNGDTIEVICAGDSVILSTPSNPGWSYLWTGPEAGLGASITVSTEGLYVLNYNDGLCSENSTIRVDVNPVPQLDFTGLRDVLCCDDTVQIDVSSYANIAIDEVYWNGALEDDGIINIYTGHYETGDSVYVMKDNCPSAIEALYFINACSYPSINAPAEIFGNDDAEMTVTYTALNGIDYTFDWQDAINFVDNTAENPLFNAPAGDYTISVDVQSNHLLNDSTMHECSKLVDLMINVIFVDDPEIPTGFTPNGDNVNDFFSPVNVDGNSVLSDFRVYNRWGELMYQYEEGSQGWDGTYQGEMQPVGVYTYYVRVDKPGNETYYHQGSVTLLK
ncbi:MAG: gliding motility-associated C-terminal domain-containing protein [Chitinophagales bacterium]